MTDLAAQPSEAPTIAPTPHDFKVAGAPQPQVAAPDPSAPDPSAGDQSSPQLAPEQPASPQLAPDQPNPPQQAPAAPGRSRATRLVALIGGGVIALVLAVGIGAWMGIETVTHSPEAVVHPYLAALTDGDVGAALSAAGVQASGPLLTDAAYRAAKNHITSYTITGVQTEGSQAAVDVDYTQGGNHHHETLELTAGGRSALFFTHWVLSPVMLDGVTVNLKAPSSAEVTINGRPVTVSNGRRFAALPGSYAVTLTGTAGYSGTRATVTLTDLSAPTNQASKDAAVSAHLTAVGDLAATAAANAWVAGCIAQPTLLPAGCSFGLENDPSFHLSNEKWTLVTPPTIAVGSWTADGWEVASKIQGAASFTSDFTAADGSSGTYFSVGDVPVTVAGLVTGFRSDGSAIFVSIPWNIGGGNDSRA